MSRYCGIENAIIRGEEHLCAVFVGPISYGGENYIHQIRIPVEDVVSFADEVAKAAVDVNDRFPG